MRRSRRTLLVALTMAALASLALPVAASAGGLSPGEDQYEGAGPPAGGSGGSDSGSSPEPRSSGGSEGGSDSSSGDTSTASSSDSDSDDVSSSGSSGDDRDCSDFSSQEDAQSFYFRQEGDPDNLDRDSDGEACEDFDYGDEFEDVDFVDASSDAYPREGIASGGGSTASTGPSPLPLLVSAGAFGLLAAGSGAFALRRRLER
jgi:hypothetical protein